MSRTRIACAVVVLVVTLGGCVGAPGTGTSSGSPAGSPPATAPGTPTPASSSMPVSSSMPAPSSSPTFAQSGELVAVLDVRCGPGAPDLASDRVRASRDGVRLHVTSVPGWQLGIEHETGRETVALATADQELVLRVAPGDVTVDCGDPTQLTLGPASALRIEDPDGWYRPMVIGDGAGTCVSGTASYGEDARGKVADPVQQAREVLRGLRAGDVVERAGYASDTGWVRVVRAGEVIGVLEFAPDGHGGWLLMGSSLCRNVGTG